MLTLYDEIMKVRLTVTLPKLQVDAVRREVEAGRAASVSEFVSQALGSRLGPEDDENTRQLKPMAEIVALDDAAVRAVGLVCGETGVGDIADVSVVVCARERGHRVVTSDPQDLRRIDPGVPLVAV